MRSASMRPAQFSFHSSRHGNSRSPWGRPAALRGRPCRCCGTGRGTSSGESALEPPTQDPPAASPHPWGGGSWSCPPTASLLTAHQRCPGTLQAGSQVRSAASRWGHGVQGLALRLRRGKAGPPCLLSASGPHTATRGSCTHCHSSVPSGVSPETRLAFPSPTTQGTAGTMQRRFGLTQLYRLHRRGGGQGAAKHVTVHRPASRPQ